MCAVVRGDRGRHAMVGECVSHALGGGNDAAAAVAAAVVTAGTAAAVALEAVEKQTNRKSR